MDATDTTPTATDAVAPVAEPSATRRRALLGLAGLATTGAAAVVVGSGAPAGANGHGQSLTLGDATNTASATTGVTMHVPGTHTLKVTNTSTGGGILAIRDQVSGIAQNGAAVTADSKSGVALEALSHNQTAITAKAINGNAISGRSELSIGVVGESAGQYGVWGQAGNVGVGVFGRSDADARQSAGVWADNAKGTALVATGKVQLRLEAAAAPGPPTKVDGFTGSLHVDSLGVLRYAAATNLWRTVATPTSAGAFHVLPAPVRAYDSRPGTVPAAGPKVKLAAGQSRTIDLKVAGTGVPAGATAALLTVLVVNAPKANGNLTVWAAGVARPQANTLVWGGDAGRFTTQATTAVDPAAQVQVVASHATDIVIDVVGYYA